jgi:hypothetical protein
MSVSLTAAVMPALFTGGSSRTLGSKLQDVVSVKDFGAVKDNGSNTASCMVVNDVAFAAAHDSFTGDVIYEGGTLWIPPGDYYFSGTFNVEKRMVIQGAGMGEQSNSNATRLVFPTDTTGIRVHTNTTAPGGGRGGYTTIRDLGLTQSTKGTSGHGIHTCVKVQIENVKVDSFGQDGIRILASAGGGVNDGNANKWYMNNVYCQDNGRAGVYVEGNDVNAGLGILIDCKDNDVYGIYDSAKLPNTWIACHSRGNQINYKDDIGSVWLGCYREISAISRNEWVASSLPIGGTNVASLDSVHPVINITGGSGSGADAIAYCSSGVVQKILITNQGSGYLSNPTVTIGDGGGSGSGASASASISGGRVTGITVTAGGSGYASTEFARINATTSGRADLSMSNATFTCWPGSEYYATVSIGVGDGIDEATVGLRAIALGDEELDLLTWNNTAKCWQVRYAKSSSKIPIRFVSDITTTETGGRSAAIDDGNIEFPLGFWIGSGSTGRFVKNATAMPTTGEYARGDFIFNTQPSIDGSNMIILGWMRLITGTSHVSGTDWAVCRVSHVSPAT